MARNGTGTYSLPAGNPVVTGTTISSTVQNNTMNDIATALTASIAADGQTPVTANIPMNSKKLTGLAAATTSGDALSYGQAGMGAFNGTTGTFSGAVATGDLTVTGSTSGSIKTTPTGQLYGTALHNNAGAMTGPTNQYVGSGTYTPTLTNISNVASTVPKLCRWTRLGNVVAVSGSYNVTPTAASAYILGITLPIAITVSSFIDVTGGSTGTTTGTLNGSCVGNSGTNGVSNGCTNASTGAQDATFWFSYTIV